MQHETSITKLKRQDGSIIEDKNEIKKIIEDYYSKTLNEEIHTNPGRDEQFLGNYRKNPLTQEQVRELTSPVSASEIKACLETAKNKKAPGIDGIPAEFYKTFWNEIAEDLVALFNEIIRKGELTDSQKRL